MRGRNINAAAYMGYKMARNSSNSEQVTSEMTQEPVSSVVCKMVRKWDESRVKK